MPTNAKRLKVPAAIRPATRQLFEALPVANEDERKACEALLDGLVDWLKPLDPIEEICTLDILYNTMKAARLRRVESALLGMQEIESDQTKPTQSDENLEKASHLIVQLAGWDRIPYDATDEEKAALAEETERKRLEWKRQRTEQARPDAGKGASDIGRADALRSAFLERSTELNQLSGQIALAEVRRSAAVRELERYRSVWHDKTNTDEIIDVEYTEAPVHHSTFPRKHDLAAATRSEPAQRAKEHRASVRARKGAVKPKRT
jgi:hypothetical protein